MKKNLLFLLSAILGVTAWSCSDDKDEPAVVGITAATVTPQGSAVSYATVVDQVTGQITNTADPVAWDVTDAQLANAVVKATPTIGATVYCNEVAVPAEGLAIDVTSPVTLTVRDEKGTTRQYTLTVTRATEAAAGQSLLLKSSSFQGFPGGVIYYDMVSYKDKFYALVVSVQGENENYQLFNSENGINWNEVSYKCTVEGQDAVIGGEGARLFVVNDRLIVFGGARTKGTDKYGNPAEIENGWMGPAPLLNARVYSSADGVNFTDDTAQLKYLNADGTEAPASRLANAYMSTAKLGGKLYIKGGYQAAFGMLQGNSAYMATSDGKTYQEVNITPADLMLIKFSQGNSFFTFKNKLWCVGGYKSWISPNNAIDKIYSSADGEAWVEEGALPAALSGLCYASVIVNDEAAILVGGQLLSAEGNSMNKKMYRSTDGITWTEIEVPTNYVARRAPSTVTLGNVGWIFGGFKNTTTGNYGWPEGEGAELLTDTWAKLID